MISIEDCVAFCGLTRAEVDAIAEHEHIDEVAASALADQLLLREGGAQRIRLMIRDDIRQAIAQGDKVHARELVAALRHFLHEHPECA